MTKFFESLQNVDPQIWAAIINTLGLVLVGLFINKNISKLNRKQKIQLARESPTYKMKIEENRIFISKHYDLMNYFLDKYYYHAMKYINILALKYKVYGFSDDEITLLKEKLLKNENEEINNLFNLYNQFHTPFYSVYLSMMPERFSFHVTLRDKFLSDILQNSLFITDEIRVRADIIYKDIYDVLASERFTHFLWMLDDNEIPFMERYNNFEEFWSSQENSLRKKIEKMQKTYIDEWFENQN